ncbi:MAG: magnesium/cobalt transporter CorA [Bacteroidales bacterium]|nr:magnesium/cobalt transporter CorA [Bacteroidales bacterium]
MARFLKNRNGLQGKAPGTLVHIGRQKIDKIHIRQISFNREEIQEHQFNDIDSVPEPDPNRVNWINIDGLHDVESLERLRSRFNISSLTMEDILNTDQRPRIYEESGHIVVIMKSFYRNEEEEAYRSEQISFVLGAHHLISFQERIGDHFDPVRDRIRSRFGRIRERNDDYLLFSLMDCLIDSYLSIIEKIGERVEMLEDKILEKHDQSVLKEIYAYRNELRLFWKNIRPIREVVGFLSKATSPLIKEETRIYLMDLEDLATQATEAIDLYYSMVSDQLNIYHTNLSNRVNDVMKVLTIFASIFIPLTLIAGIYGTNFDYIPELKWHWGYFMMLGVMVAVVVVMLIYFKRKRWF